MEDEEARNIRCTKRVPHIFKYILLKFTLKMINCIMRIEQNASFPETKLKGDKR